MLTDLLIRPFAVSPEIDTTKTIDSVIAVLSTPIIDRRAIFLNSQDLIIGLEVTTSDRKFDFENFMKKMEISLPLWTLSVELRHSTAIVYRHTSTPAALTGNFSWQPDASAFCRSPDGILVFFRATYKVEAALLGSSELSLVMKLQVVAVPLIKSSISDDNSNKLLSSMASSKKLPPLVATTTKAPPPIRPTSKSCCA